MTKRKTSTTTRKRTTKAKTKRRVSGKAATPDAEVKRQAERELMEPKTPKPPAPKKARGTQAIQSAWPGRLIVSNAPSGARYEWRDAGHIVEVALEDVEFLMEKNRSDARECCGDSHRTYFVLAD